MANTTIRVPYVSLRLIKFRGLELHGFSPTVVRFAYRVPARKQLTFTGYAPSRATGLLLRGSIPNLVYEDTVPPTRQLVLSTKQPQIVNTAPQSKVIAVPEIMRAFMGYVPVLAAGQETELSSMIIEGWGPISIASSPMFFPARRSLVFAGQSTSIAGGTQAITITAGSLTLSAKSLTASTSLNKFASPAVSSISFSGSAPVLFNLDRLAEPDAITLSLAGQLVFLKRTITPAAVARRLNGKVPTAIIGINRVISPAVEALSLSGSAPASNRGFSPAPLVGAVVLSAKAVTISRTTGSLRLPAVRRLNLDRHEPEAHTAIFIQVAAAALRLNTSIVNPEGSIFQIDGARTGLISLTVDRELISLYL